MLREDIRILLSLYKLDIQPYFIIIIIIILTILYISQEEIMLRSQKDSILSLARVHTDPILLLAVALFLLFSCSVLFAQEDVNLQVGDVEFNYTDSTFEVPVYLQTLSDSIAALLITIAFDSPDLAVFNMSDPMFDSNEVIWNWGMSFDDYGTGGRMIRVLSSAMPHGSPIPPSEDTYLLFTLTAFPGDGITEMDCNYNGVINVELSQTQFSDPIGNSLDFDSDNGKYVLRCIDCGDANDDRFVNVSDAVYIINYVFVGGPAPYNYEAGDTNCDDLVNVSDAVSIINFVFTGGNEPCDTDGDDVPDCTIEL
jgi:Dockerin type I domain